MIHVLLSLGLGSTRRSIIGAIESETPHHTTQEAYGGFGGQLPDARSRFISHWLYVAIFHSHFGVHIGRCNTYVICGWEESVSRRSSHFDGFRLDHHDQTVGRMAGGIPVIYPNWLLMAIEAVTQDVFCFRRIFAFWPSLKLWTSIFFHRHHRLVVTREQAIRRSSWDLLDSATPTSS